MKSVRNLLLSLVVLSLTTTTAFGADNAYNLPTADPEEVGMSTERVERVKDVMRTFVDDGKVKGLLTAIVREGKIVHFETYGMMDADQRGATEAEAMDPMAYMDPDLLDLFLELDR